MTNYRETSAYDLSLFEPQVVEPRRERPTPDNRKQAVKKPVKKTTAKKTAVKKTAPKKSAATRPAAPRYTDIRSNETVRRATQTVDAYQTTVNRSSQKAVISGNVRKGIISAAVLFVLLVVKLFMAAECDRLDSKITYMENQVSIAEGETVRLNAELNSLIDTEKIIEYAETELGMVKAESYQITYIDLSKGDEVVVSGDKEVKENGELGSEIKSLFAYIF